MANESWNKLMETEVGELVRKAAKYDQVIHAFWRYFDAMDDRFNFIEKHMKLAEDIRAIMKGMYPRPHKVLDETEGCPFCGSEEFDYTSRLSCGNLHFYECKGCRVTTVTDEDDVILNWFIDK